MLLAMSMDEIQLKKRGSESGVDDTAGNNWLSLVPAHMASTPRVARCDVVALVPSNVYSGLSGGSATPHAQFIEVSPVRTDRLVGVSGRLSDANETKMFGANERGGRVACLARYFTITRHG